MDARVFKQAFEGSLSPGSHPQESSFLFQNLRELPTTLGEQPKLFSKPPNPSQCHPSQPCQLSSHPPHLPVPLQSLTSPQNILYGFLPDRNALLPSLHLDPIHLILQDPGRWVFLENFPHLTQVLLVYFIIYKL